jgi:hypothetical protein
MSKLDASSYFVYFVFFSENAIPCSSQQIVLRYTVTCPKANLRLKSQRIFISFGRKTCHLDADTSKRKLHLLHSLLQGILMCEILPSMQSGFVHSSSKLLVADSRTIPSSDTHCSTSLLTSFTEKFSVNFLSQWNNS